MINRQNEFINLRANMLWTKFVSILIRIKSFPFSISNAESVLFKHEIAWQISLLFIMILSSSENKLNWIKSHRVVEIYNFGIVCSSFSKSSLLIWGAAFMLLLCIRDIFIAFSSDLFLSTKQLKMLKCWIESKIFATRIKF